jgi:[CysO sulfur-carrier protein]-S-L-cysteine hydrolase
MALGSLPGGLSPPTGLVVVAIVAIAMITITAAVHARLVGQAYDEYPMEMCGLIAGSVTPAAARTYYPCTNIAGSARVYTIEPKDHLRAELDAEDHGMEIIGVVHSHTHSEPYPSPTDVAQAPDPSWHYLIVSLKHEAPSLRSYRIVDGQITEEPITIVR